MNFIIFLIYLLCIINRSILSLETLNYNNASVKNHVLVIGGAGFLGFSLAYKLSSLSWIASITCVDNLTPYYPIRLKYDRMGYLLRHKKIKFVHCNISDSISLGRLLERNHIDSVVYLAHYPHLKRCRKLDCQNRADSSQMFLNLFISFSQHYNDFSIISSSNHIKIPKIIYISSKYSYDQLFEDCNYLVNHSIQSFFTNNIDKLSWRLPINEVISRKVPLVSPILSVGLRIPSLTTVYGPWNPPNWLYMSINHTHNVQSLLYHSIDSHHHRNIVLPGTMRERFKCDAANEVVSMGYSYQKSIYVEDIVDAMISTLLSHSFISNHINNHRVIEIKPSTESSSTNLSFALQYLSENINKNVNNYKPNFLSDFNVESNILKISNDQNSSVIETYVSQIPFDQGIKETFTWYQHYTAKLWPCASECHNSKNLCHTTKWDQLIPLTKDLTDGCPIVIYTICTFKATHLPDIEAIYNSKDPINKRCILAFVDSRSYLIQVMKAAQGTDYGNWTMVEIKLDDYFDKLPKFSPTTFFALNVKYAFYIDSMLNKNKPIRGNPLNALKYFYEHPTSIDNDNTTSATTNTTITSKSLERKAVIIVLRDVSYNSLYINNVLKFGWYSLRENYNKLLAAQLHHYRKYGDLFHMYYSNYYSPQLILYDLHSYTTGQAYRCALYQEIIHWGGSQNEIFSASYTIENMHRITKSSDKLYYQIKEWISIGKNKSNYMENIRILPYNSYNINNLFL